jgi:hypothetical protein
MEKDAKWLARRKEDDKLRNRTGAGIIANQQKPDPIEWEEHDLEYQMASMGLAMENLFMMEDRGDDETDCLDVWMGSLEVEGCS